MGQFKAACIQMCSAISPAENAKQLSEGIDEAVSKGALYMQTPEMTNIMAKGRVQLFDNIFHQGEDPVLKLAREKASQHGVYIHLGSIALKMLDMMAVNRAFFITPTGEIAAHYDKIHMFDVDLGGDEVYRESATYQPGSRAVTVASDIGKFGFSICYDLRFPALYRGYGQSDVQILTAPAAFTQPTGKAHWHVLNRSRAIENGSFMISAAQAGDHECTRKTFGHSVIINPWGEILAEANHLDYGVITADIDLTEVETARRKVASLTHDRSFDLDQISL